MPGNDTLEYIKERVDDIHYAIYGNGEPGLKARVVVLEKSDEDRAAREARAVESRSWLVRAIVAALILNSVASGFAVVKWAMLPAKTEQVQTK
jgi:hypothetical protein